MSSKYIVHNNKRQFAWGGWAIQMSDDAQKSRLKFLPTGSSLHKLSALLTLALLLGKNTQGGWLTALSEKVRAAGEACVGWLAHHGECITGFNDLHVMPFLLVIHCNFWAVQRELTTAFWIAWAWLACSTFPPSYPQFFTFLRFSSLFFGFLREPFWAMREEKWRNVKKNGENGEKWRKPENSGAVLTGRRLGKPESW